MSGRSPPFPDRGSSMDFLDVVIVALGWIPKEVLRIATYIRAFNQQTTKSKFSRGCCTRKR
jgi:hypothetical protein